MGTLNIRRTLIIAAIMALFVSYLGIWMRFIHDPVERTGSDFIAFYSAGRVAQQEGIRHTYDPILQQAIQQEQVGFPLVPGQVLLYNHLPFLVPILQGMVSASYVASFYRWVILLIILYLCGIGVLSKAIKQTGIDQTSTLLSAIGGFLFLPIFFSLMNGQDTPILFLGAALWMYGLLSGKEVLAGIGLSLTTVRPQVALFLAIPMIFRHLKVFLAFGLGAGLLAIFSVALLGVQGTKDYIHILMLSAGGEWYGMKEYAMYNLIGMLTRLTPQFEAGTIRIIGWIVYGLAMISVCMLWSMDRRANEPWIATTITLALFVAPHLHFHDLALLLLPIYELIRKSVEGGYLKTSTAIALPIAISMLLLVSNISPYLQYTVPYLIMLALVLYPDYLKTKTPFAAPHQS